MTNNKLTTEIIKKMYYCAFNNVPTKLGIKKLSGGLKNLVYLLDDGQKYYVLKTEPINKKI